MSRVESRALHAGPPKVFSAQNSTCETQKPPTHGRLHLCSPWIPVLFFFGNQEPVGEKTYPIW